MMQSQILDFYENKNVFITGGTGFLGKVLIEKLLRSTNAATLYILIRQNKNRDASTRLERMLDCELFDELRKKRPDYKRRIIAIAGDSAKDNLDLAPEDQEELISKVNIVFHVAATVHFNENLKVAYEVNVQGTKRLLDLSKRFQHLKSIVHVSTAYANWQDEVIDESFCERSFHYKQVESMLQKLSIEEALRLTPSILKKWDSTYAFTKAMAEVLVKENSNGLPIGIFRPSGIVPSYKEPVNNWIDSFGALGLLAFVSLGIARVIPSRLGPIVDLVPVDLVASALIATAWDIPTKDGIPIYNYVSSIDNPITFQDFIASFKTHLPRYPLSKAVRAPKVITQFTTFSKIQHHYLPALLVDLVYVMTLRKPKMLPTIRKFDSLVEIAALTLDKNWQFANNNVKSLWNKMNEDDRKLFPCDVSIVDWKHHFDNFVKGVRVYLFKDPLSTLPEAKIRMQRLEKAHDALQLLLYFILENVGWTLLPKL